MTKSTRTIAKKDFLKTIESIGSHFREDNADGRLNTLLSKDHAPFSLIQGFIIESYHCIRSAPQHIGIALTHATCSKYRDILLALFLDEHNHAPLFMDTLKRLGFKEDEIIASTPTIGTLSLVSLLSDLGRKSSLAYIACTSLNEATREDVKKEKRSFRFFADKYGLPYNTFKGLLTHSEEDLRCSHVHLVEKALLGVDRIPRNEAEEVYESMYATGRAYLQFNDSIATYYAATDCRLPRPKGMKTFA